MYLNWKGTIKNQYHCILQPFEQYLYYNNKISVRNGKILRINSYHNCFGSTCTPSNPVKFKAVSFIGKLHQMLLSTAVKAKMNTVCCTLWFYFTTGK